MSHRLEDIERTVIAAIASTNPGQAAQLQADTVVLHVLDSLGFFTALVDLQEALNISLAPNEILRLFNCHRIADVTNTLLQLTAKTADCATVERTT